MERVVEIRPQRVRRCVIRRKLWNRREAMIRSKHDDDTRGIAQPVERVEEISNELVCPENLIVRLTRVWPEAVIDCVSGRQ